MCSLDKLCFNSLAISIMCNHFDKQCCVWLETEAVHLYWDFGYLYIHLVICYGISLTRGVNILTSVQLQNNNKDAFVTLLLASWFVNSKFASE